MVYLLLSLQIKLEQRVLTLKITHSRTKARIKKHEANKVYKNLLVISKHIRYLQPTSCHVVPLKDVSTVPVSDRLKQ